VRRWLWVLLLSSAATAIAADTIAGSWINENSGTGGVTRVVIRSEGLLLFAHAWGACQPSDCDWGEVQCARHGAGCKANWDHGFATTAMQLVPFEGGRLRIKYKFDFHDNSGRRCLGTEETFAHGEPPPQVALSEPPQVGRNPIRNLTPEEASKRMLQCVLPSYPDSQARPLVSATVAIGLVISPTGEVIDGTRFLSGPALFKDSAMQAVSQWKFRPDSEDEQAALGRVRALIWYKADGSAEVALAPAVLPDSFGDPGTPRSEGGRSWLSCASM
jgi:Gram-negative bacterial TonB protein C-terminal